MPYVSKPRPSPKNPPPPPEQKKRLRIQYIAEDIRAPEAFRLIPGFAVYRNRARRHSQNSLRICAGTTTETPFPWSALRHFFQVVILTLSVAEWGRIPAFVVACFRSLLVSRCCLFSGVVVISPRA